MKLSIVSTLYYSEAFVEEFVKRCVESAEQVFPDFEIILVDDGSPDRSSLLIRRLIEQDERIKLVELSRNHGHHIAIMTGLDFSTGDYVFLIDSDLEEPPESLVSMWSEIERDSTFDVVYGIQPERKGGLVERVSGELFYKAFSLLSALDYPKNTLTSRLMSRRYVNAVTQFRERQVDIWCVFVLAGFKQKGIVIRKGFKGDTTYTLARKLRMAIETVTSISNRPLYLIFLAGLLSTLVASSYLMAIIIQRLFFSVSVEGWASLMASVWCIGGILMFSVGTIGIYISRLFIEVKQRPYSVVRCTAGSFGRQI